MREPLSLRIVGRVGAGAGACLRTTTGTTVCMARDDRFARQAIEAPHTVIPSMRTMLS
jgi:hypothetical protein